MVLFMTNGTAVVQMGHTAVCIEEEGPHCNREKPLVSIQYFTNQNIFPPVWIFEHIKTVNIRSWFKIRCYWEKSQFNELTVVLY